MPTLTYEQKQALNQAGDAPVLISDPDSNDAFILLKADVYQRMLDAVENDFDPRETYPNVDRIMADDDAEDPYLHLYQDEP